MSGAAIIILLMLCSAIWVALDVRDTRRLKIFGLTWVIALYSFISGLELDFEDTLLPVKFDGLLYQIDTALGLSSFPVANALRLWTGAFLGYVYTAMLPLMMLWYALGLHLNWKGPSILWAYAVEMGLGPILYMVVPACGPVYAFPGFPSRLPEAVVGVMQLRGYPNAIPSLHISTALLLFLFAQGKFWKTASFLFLVGTALATLATGEHYVIDLVVGLPFACLVHAAAHFKIRSTAIWSAVVMVWLVAIRTETPSLVSHALALRGAAILTVISVGWYCCDLTPTAVAKWPVRFFAWPERKAAPEQA